MMVYLSGPITGVKDYELRFERAESWLMKKGFATVNPVKISKRVEKRLGREGKWHEYLAEDILELGECDAIALLPGWKDSAGARLELAVARHLGFVEIRVPASLYGEEN